MVPPAFMKAKVMILILGLCLCIGAHVSGICDEGFVHQYAQCLDVNECVESLQPICGLNAQCINTNGSFYCNCNRGYRSIIPEPTQKLAAALMVEDPCEDINECVERTHTCDFSRTCVNKPGSFKCVCRDGFKATCLGGDHCIDVNECVESLQPVCGLNAQCINTNGSFYCKCNRGYRSTIPEQTLKLAAALMVEDPCEDINECVERTHTCDASHICVNTPGSFKCVCSDGFRSLDICVDINECLGNITVCGPYGNCTNTPGSYMCSCPAGFRSQDSNSNRSPCEAWLNILEMECKDTDALCKLNTLLDMEKNLTESSRIPPLVLFSALDVFLKSPPVAQEDNVLELTERLIQKVQTSSLTNSTQRFRINDTVVDMASIGPNTSQTASLHLRTIDVLEIDLWAIAQNNNGSASVVALSSGSMHKVFNSSHFHARDAEQTYIGAKLELIVLPQVKDKTLSTPVNITFRHFKDSDPADEPACVFWSKGTWITDGCVVSQSNSTLTVCTCSHLSTFALIMQTNPTTESNPFVEKLAAFFVVVGLIFLILAVLTFAFCRRNTRVTNVARLNLSVSLLLAHALFFITQTAIKVNKPPMALCKLLAGVLHFLFLSSFVWMSAEALLLFLSVRKLRQIKAKDHMGPHWRYKLLIGYGIPLVIVSVSAMAVPDGHGSKECWLKTDKGFNWSFLGPACIILTANIILFVITFITIHTTLRAAKSEVSKVKYTRLLLFKLMAQCVILGCPWIFLMASEKSGVLEIIFVILTSQQGTTIFLIHCVLNDEARKQYATLWRKYDPRHKPSSSVVFTSNKHCSDTQHTPVPLSQYTLDGTNESD